MKEIARIALSATRKAAICAAALLALQANAQEQMAAPAGKLSAYVGGGLHPVLCSIDGGTSSMGGGIAAGASYSRSVAGPWGVAAGIGIATYSGTSKIDGSIECGTADAIQGGGMPYILCTRFGGLKEKQNVTMLNIPVGATYSVPLPKGMALTASAGLMASITLSAKYKTTEGTVTTSGKYPDLGLEIEDMPEHGFTEYASKYSGKIRTKGAGLGLFAEAGASIPIGTSNAYGVYLGAYASYGLTSLSKPGSEKIVRLSENEENNAPDYRGALNSSMSGSAHLMSVGLKVAVSFGL